MPLLAQGRRRQATALLLALCLPLASALGVSAAHAAETLEYAVKATFLLKFPAFVTWRDPLPQANFNVCVVGSNPFNGLLRDAAVGQTIEQRPIAIHVLSDAGAVSACQVMFVSHSDPLSVAAVLRAARGTQVLTVTDEQSAPGAKGIINFVLADDRVRFEINLRAAAANGLTISSKLLSIALHVYGKA